MLTPHTHHDESTLDRRHESGQTQREKNSQYNAQTKFSLAHETSSTGQYRTQQKTAIISKKS